MNIDDLRDVLNEDQPEGLDGEEVLAFAKRARTKRRIGVAGGVAASLMVVVGIASALPYLPNTNTEPGLTASPSHHTPSGIRTSSNAPTTTAAPTVSTSPTMSPSVTPSTTNKGPQTTDSTGTQSPGSDGSADPTGTTGPSTVPGAITRLCTVDRSLVFNASPYMVSIEPGGRMGLDNENGDVSVNGKTIKKFSAGTDVMASGSDGRHVVFLVVEGGNQGGEPAMALYSWDVQAGGEAKLVSDQYVFNGDLQVRDGYALFSTGGEEGDVAVQLLDLSSGTIRQIHSGEYGPPSLLDGGRYLVPVPGPVGMRDSGNAPQRPTMPDGSPVEMYSPYYTNGSSWVFADGNPGEGDVNIKVWSPTMPEPITVFNGRVEVFLTGVGKDYALMYERDKAFHLVDLRTGGYTRLPSGPSGPYYSLTAQDVLLRNAGDTSNATGGKGWVDLSNQKLEC